MPAKVGTPQPALVTCDCRGRRLWKTRVGLPQQILVSFVAQSSEPFDFVQRRCNSTGNPTGFKLIPQPAPIAAKGSFLPLFL